MTACARILPGSGRATPIHPPSGDTSRQGRVFRPDRPGPAFPRPSGDRDFCPDPSILNGTAKVTFRLYAGGTFTRFLLSLHGFPGNLREMKKLFLFAFGLGVAI